MSQQISLERSNTNIHIQVSLLLPLLSRKLSKGLSYIDYVIIRISPFSAFLHIIQVTITFIHSSPRNVISSYISLDEAFDRSCGSEWIFLELGISIYNECVRLGSRSTYCTRSLMDKTLPVQISCEAGQRNQYSPLSRHLAERIT